MDNRQIELMIERSIEMLLRENSTGKKTKFKKSTSEKSIWFSKSGNEEKKNTILKHVK